MKESFFQFEEPYLMHFSFTENSHFNDALYKDLNIACQTQVRDHKDHRSAFITVSLTVGGTEADDPFLLEIKMGAIFSWNETDQEELVENLKKYNAPSLLISYIRPIVALVTSSSRYPTLNIPFMDLRDEESE